MRTMIAAAALLGLCAQAHAATATRAGFGQLADGTKVEAVTLTNSAGMSGDKQGTLLTLFTLAMQHGMIWVSQGLMPANTRAAKRDDVNYLVSYSGAIAQSPSDAGADAMSPGDLETARLFGARVADIASRFRK